MQQRAPRFDPRLIDALVVAAVALPGIIGLVLFVRVTGAGPGAIPVAGATLMLVQAGVLWWRRRHPLLVLAVTLATLVIGRVLVGVDADELLSRETIESFLGPYAAAYAVAAYGSRRAAVVGLAGVVATAALDFVVTSASSTVPTVLSPIGPLMTVMWGIGRYVRVRRDYLNTLVAYADQLEVERDAKARRAVLEERRRIARELHDQVAHHLGIAALHTSAARRWLGRDVDRAGAAMASAEDAVRGALTTMPVILQALRVDETAGDLAPQPTVNDLAQLTAQVSEAGLDVELRVEGERRQLEPAVELAAYRIVQEALTNTLKHAGASRSTVLLRFADDRLEIEVVDDGSGGSAQGGDGGGLGLAGMRERVDVLGGELVASPQDGGGFLVRASLPVEGREGAGR